MPVDPIERVRRLCLALPETSERLSHGEPIWFVHKRCFAMFANNHHNDGHMAIWVPVPDGAQADLIAKNARRYFRPPYVGVKGWVGIDLRHIGARELRFHIGMAWEICAPKRLLAPQPGKAQTTKGLRRD
ncbi:MAG TPA: MmcQ/YjbR family DNA-binding protein [Anaerolineales bacterium]|nr:MmcQ/YjbR family DNA-binding protein [Anaerolineales bacterium]HRF47097.1 MmcQ/YjbR family DNA-binding protein [Anaerolineales bacterium]